MSLRDMFTIGGTGFIGGSSRKPYVKPGSRPKSQNPNILVTGGAGYIGSHTCKALAEAGYQPVVLDNLVSGHRWAVKWGPLIEGDLQDFDVLAKILNEYQIQAVMHFAAYAYVGESMQMPGKYFRNNVSNTINLLDAMVSTGVNKLVYSSSCATYGEPCEIPISETHPQRPINPYGESKLFMERAIHWYGVAHGLRSFIMRYFNAAGDDPDGEVGEDHTPETHLVPLVIQAALGQREELKVYGTDYNTPDGTAVRDYIHVCDLADAHLLALGKLLSGSESHSLNLGSGKGTSAREVISAVERISGMPVNVSYSPRRPGDPAILVASAKVASSVLGWQPRCSDLESIVPTALNWHMKHVPSNYPAAQPRQHQSGVRKEMLECSEHP